MRFATLSGGAVKFKWWATGVVVFRYITVMCDFSAHAHDEHDAWW